MRNFITLQNLKYQNNIQVILLRELERGKMASFNTYLSLLQIKKALYKDHE